MQDWYQMPALVLTLLLLPGFGQLYWRTRDIRNLLWFLAFLCAIARMLLVYPAVTTDFLITTHPWRAAAAQSCSLAAAALFLGSLSPLSFRFRSHRVLYVIPFTLPLVAYTLLAHGIFRLGQPQGIWAFVFAALGLLSIGVGLLWAVSKGTLPPPIGLFICVLFGGMAFVLYVRNGLQWPLVFAESGCHLLMALLVISVFRRVSPGVFLAVLGFAVWAAPILRIFPWFHQPEVELALMRCIMLARVAAAFGLLLLALENELAVNRAAGERERRARREMEAYDNLSLQRRRVEDFDRLAHEICTLIAECSRFNQVALLLLQPTGIFRLAGSAGLDGAVVRALDSLAARLPVNGFLEPGSAVPAIDNSQTVRLDLRPYLLPGDDLEHLHFTSAWAIPLRGRSATEGVLLLGRVLGNEELRLEDLVPLEIFMARLQAMRSQTRMLEKLIDAEKFAGLGQLAGNVFAQLSNPLTVILGYASLLDEAKLDPQSKRGADAILNSARSMRSTLESLQRITRSPGGQLSAVAVDELLGDMERLHRSEFLQRGIEFHVGVAETLPRILCQPQQLRQAILHCLQFAMDALDRVEGEGERVVRLEGSAEDDRVQIVIAHTGPGFEKPDRAFDPFVPPQAGGAETAGLGLSLCATILRDNNGRASAMNLEPTGAAIILDLQAA